VAEKAKRGQSLSFLVLNIHLVCRCALQGSQGGQRLPVGALQGQERETTLLNNQRPASVPLPVNGVIKKE